MKIFARSMALAALTVIGTCSLPAAVVVTVNFDENGNGSYTVNSVTTPLSFALAQDPGPGGLAGVLIYSGLPFAGVQGDLEILDGGIPGDILRWNGNNTIAVYSDTPPVDSLADTASPPGAAYTNLVTTPEVGPESSNGVTWQPTGSQPGASGTTDFTFTYNFTSDGVPEPGTLAMIPIGLAAFGLLAMRRRRAQQ